MMQLLSWLKATCESLAIQAQRDKDPDFYAEVVLDNLPDGMTSAMLLDYLGRENWWVMLTAVCPAVTPYQGWFSRFRDAALELVREQAEELRAKKLRENPPPDDSTRTAGDGE